MAPGNTPRGVVSVLKWLLAVLMMVIGLAIGILGYKLVAVGGSPYFLIMGIVMVVAAGLIIKNRPSGILLYALAFIVSLFWAVSDAGWSFWPLFSRLFTFGVLALLAALLWPLLRAQQRATPLRKSSFSLAGVLAVLLLVSAGGMFKTWNVIAPTEAIPVKPVAPGDGAAKELGTLGQHHPRRPFRRAGPD